MNYVSLLALRLNYMPRCKTWLIYDVVAKFIGIIHLWGCPGARTMGSGWEL